MLPRLFLCSAAPLLPAYAQQTFPPAAGPVASVSAENVTLRGELSIKDGRAFLENNGEVTASEKSASLTLTRGGSLEICPTTKVQIARSSAQTPGSLGAAGLLFSLNRGAFEARYTPSAYSDVILTPDLRLLVSGPGQADLKLRVNAQGDTCVDNAGENAPYVVASSLLDGGAYRVQPGQRVLFVRGTLRDVVDNEHELCGCPAPEPSVAGKGGPSSTPADTAFPTAVSEGLEAPPALGGPAPVVPDGQPHAQVTAILSSDMPPVAPPTNITVVPDPPPPKRGFFGSISHFFGKVLRAS